MRQVVRKINTIQLKLYHKTVYIVFYLICLLSSPGLWEGAMERGRERVQYYGKRASGGGRWAAAAERIKGWRGVINAKTEKGREWEWKGGETKEGSKEEGRGIGRQTTRSTN